MSSRAASSSCCQPRPSARRLGRPERRPLEVVPRTTSTLDRRGRAVSLLVTAAIWDERNFSSDELPGPDSRDTRDLWIDGSTLLVHQAIGDRADDNGYAFPGGEEVRRRARLQTDRGVRMCLERLKRTGHLVVLIEAHGEGYPNFYQVLTGRPERKIIRDLLDQRDAKGNFRRQEDADAYAALMAELREAGLRWLQAKGFAHRVLTPALRESLVTPRRRSRNRNSSAGSEPKRPAKSDAENRNSSAGSGTGPDPDQNRNNSAGSGDQKGKSSTGSGQGGDEEPEEPFPENRNRPSPPYMDEQPAVQQSGVVVHREEQQHQPEGAPGTQPDDTTVRDDLADQLVQLGVSPIAASDLVGRHSAERLETVLHAARTKTLKNRPGWIVAALAGNWALPPPPGRRGSGTADPPVEPPVDAAVAAYEQAADQALDGLAPEERQPLEEAARATVVRRHGMGVFNSPYGLGDVLVLLEVRQLVAERTGIPIPDAAQHDADRPSPPAGTS